MLNQLGHGGLRERSGVASTAARLHYWKDGQVLAVGLAGGQEAPPPDRPYTVHRLDLSQELASAVPPGSLHFGRQCVAAEEDADGITAVFADGGAVRASALIAADGLHSRLRRLRVAGPPAAYSGRDVIRGLARLGDIDARFAGLTESWAWIGPAGSRCATRSARASSSTLSRASPAASRCRTTGTPGSTTITGPPCSAPSPGGTGRLSGCWSGWRSPAGGLVDREPVTGGAAGA